MIRVRRKDDEDRVYGKEYDDEKICIDFNKKIVSWWNGAYWEEYAFDEFNTISYWEP